MSQSVESGKRNNRSNNERPQRQHHARVDEALPVVACQVQRGRQQDHGEKRTAGEVQEAQSIGCRRRSVEQHAVGDEAHEQRLDHLEPGREDGERKDEADRVALRPKPAQVVLEVLAALGTARCLRRSSGRRVVERSRRVIAAEDVVVLAGRARTIHGATIPERASAHELAGCRGRAPKEAVSRYASTLAYSRASAAHHDNRELTCASSSES